MSQFGPAYDEKIDGERIRTQMEKILEGMLWSSSRNKEHSWFTLQEMRLRFGYPEASISSQLRHLRKARFGGYQVMKRRRSGGLWEYLVLPPLPKPEQMRLIK